MFTTSFFHLTINQLKKPPRSENNICLIGVFLLAFDLCRDIFKIGERNQIV